MKKSIFFLSIFLVFVSSVEAQQSEIYAPGGRAINGYDAVAFFKVGKPVMGKENFSYTWKNAEWLFSSQENLDSFQISPEKYAPQYGGYCAYGCSQGHQSPTDVNTFTILNNKLYFNYNKEVQDIWLKDQKKLIEKADKAYPPKDEKSAK